MAELFDTSTDNLSRTLANRQLVNVNVEGEGEGEGEGEAVLGVIADDAHSSSLLQRHDEQRLTGQTVKQGDMRALHLNDVLVAIG